MTNRARIRQKSLKSRLFMHPWPLNSWTGAALVCGLLGAIGTVQPASAQSLEQAMAQAYVTNPTLDAQRASLRATDEGVPQALGAYRPQLTGQLSVGRSISYTDPITSGVADGRATPKIAQLSVSQPIYRGGRLSAGVSNAENLVEAQRAALLDTEQRVLLQVATSYMDVVRDQALVKLSINNEQVLVRQLEAAQDRFRVGEITRTDVSQAESRLARAKANRINYEGQLTGSRSTYERVVGALPGQLAPPKPAFKLPVTLEEGIELAKSNNPAVLSALFNERASQDRIDVANADRLPDVSLTASARRSWDPSATIDRQDTLSVQGQVTIPLYTGGGAEARVREAKHTANQRRIQLEEQRRQTAESAIRAWQSLDTARASIKSREAQVRAAEIALEGVRQEASVGSRTVLETLDAEQELLDAKVQLVTSQRDEVVGAFTLLSAVGQLTARQLGLPVEYYDFTAHYKAVRGKWWGTGIDP